MWSFGQIGQPKSYKHNEVPEWRERDCDRQTDRDYGDPDGLMIVDGYQQATQRVWGFNPSEGMPARARGERHTAATHQKPHHQITKGFSFPGWPFSRSAPGGSSRPSSLLIQDLQSLFSSLRPLSTFLHSPLQYTDCYKKQSHMWRWRTGSVQMDEGEEDGQVERTVVDMRDLQHWGREQSNHYLIYKEMCNIFTPGLNLLKTWFIYQITRRMFTVNLIHFSRVLTDTLGKVELNQVTPHTWLVLSYRDKK